MSGVLSLLMVGGGLRAVASGDADAQGFAPPNTQTLTTNTVTVTPSGGSGIYTHSWAYVSGDAVFTISNANAATVDWTATVGLIQRTATWRDTVSDGTNSVTVDVIVTAVVNN